MIARKNQKDKHIIKPIGDRIVIKYISDELKQNSSGIIIPDTVDKKQTDRGKVVAVGEGKYDNNGNLIPMSIKKGDIVIFQWGDKIEHEGEEYFIVNEGNILAVIK